MNDSIQPDGPDPMLGAESAEAIPVDDVPTPLGQQRPSTTQPENPNDVAGGNAEPMVNMAGYDDTSVAEANAFFQRVREQSSEDEDAMAALGDPIRLAFYASQSLSIDTREAMVRVPAETIMFQAQSQKLGVSIGFAEQMQGVMRDLMENPDLTINDFEDVEEWEGIQHEPEVEFNDRPTPPRSFAQKAGSDAATMFAAVGGALFVKLGSILFPEAFGSKEEEEPEGYYQPAAMPSHAGGQRYLIYDWAPKPKELATLIGFGNGLSYRASAIDTLDRDGDKIVVNRGQKAERVYTYQSEDHAIAFYALARGQLDGILSAMAQVVDTTLLKSRHEEEEGEPEGAPDDAFEGLEENPETNPGAIL